MMNHKKHIAGVLAAVMTLSAVGSLSTRVHAYGPDKVSIQIGSEPVALEGAREVGANIEMSMISDEMWSANGSWMEQTFGAGQLNMMRWGYDAWAFDWEKEVPLSANRYWGGRNTQDAAGTFGLQEFIRFCKQEDIVPFVMIPIESLDAFGGEATVDKVKELTASMAKYIAEQGFDACYFDMGNEPWNNGAGSISSAKYLGSLFPEFQRIVKDANPNFKLVLQRAPENILWNGWNKALVAAADGAFDAYDDHRYSFYGWNKYFDYNADDILTPGTPIENKEGILGECNIGWTPIDSNWDAGHVRDMGGSMALLNAMLNMIEDGRYNYIVSWPSHYPSKASIEGCPENSFGWFDLDKWYNDQQTVRLTGPAIAHRIINQNVLENRLSASSDAKKVRVFAYTNADKTDLRVIVLNKWDPTTLTVNIPSGFNSVSAMVMSGESVWDTAPEYKSLFSGSQTVTGDSYTGKIPGECVVVYEFSADHADTTPLSADLLTPENNASGISTAQTFRWSPADRSENYHLTVSAHADLSNPVIDTDTGSACRYQSSQELLPGTTYYWQVTASNQAGSAAASVRQFTTAGTPPQTDPSESADYAVFYSGDSTGSTHFRIPFLWTTQRGNLIAGADANFGSGGDSAENIDVAFRLKPNAAQYAPDEGWRDGFVPDALHMTDYSDENGYRQKSASFIDGVILQDTMHTGRTLLLVDAFAWNGGLFQHLADASGGTQTRTVAKGDGFCTIGGQKYLLLSSQNIKGDGNGRTGNINNNTDRTKFDYAADIYGTPDENGHYAVYHLNGTPQGYSAFTASVDDSGLSLGDRSEYTLTRDYELCKNGELLTVQQKSGPEETPGQSVPMRIFYEDSELQMYNTSYIMQFYSEDDGETWHTDKIITGMVKRENSNYYILGPGRGLQIQNGPYAGRLIVPVYYQGKPNAEVIFSDDGGSTWTHGESVPTLHGLSESAPVEMPDGSLKLFLRNTSAFGGTVVEATSTDGGQTWQDVKPTFGYDSAGINCQVSAIALSQTVTSQKDGKQYPAVVLSSANLKNRTHGRIFVGLVKEDGAYSDGSQKYTIDWEYQHDITPEGQLFAYSCLTELPDGRIGILYETSPNSSWDDGLQKTHYQELNLSQLIH